MIHTFTTKQVGKFYPDFYKAKVGHNLSEELADVILDAKYKDFDKKNPPADDLAQMISYIHVMDARRGEFIYPSREKTEADKPWTVRPFATTSAEIGTRPFWIPQEAKDYSEFRKMIEESEEQI